MTEIVRPRDSYVLTAAGVLNMVPWPDSKYRGIDLISLDMKKVAHVNYHDNKINWSDVTLFLAGIATVGLRSTKDAILVTTPGTKISKSVHKAIPNIVFMDDSGIVLNRGYFVNELLTILNTKNTSELIDIISKIA